MAVRLSVPIKRTSSGRAVVSANVVRCVNRGLISIVSVAMCNGNGLCIEVKRVNALES